MKRTRDASLKRLNSFGVEARAGELIVLETDADLQAFAADFHFDPEGDLVLGGGSNILFAGDVGGCVVLNRLAGKTIVEDDGKTAVVDVAAGENWHGLVTWSLEQNLAGIENLSLIPGLAGAAPIQNIGAYGVELSDVLGSVTVLDLVKGGVREFTAADCGLGYRESRFKTADAGRYMVTRIRLHLSRKFRPRLAYAGLRDELQAMGVSDPTATQVSEAVVRLRRRKLPDPAVEGNAGSFFKNPVVSDEFATALRDSHPGMPVLPVGDGKAKLSAAWLIERLGWKGRAIGGAAVSERHALVLVNRDGATGAQLLELAVAIQTSVKREFGIALEPEPRIVIPQ
jgi:UDP-N-acetylmuramate dehydrogenase